MPTLQNRPSNRQIYLPSCISSHTIIQAGTFTVPVRCDAEYLYAVWLVWQNNTVQIAKGLNMPIYVCPIYTGKTPPVAGNDDHHRYKAVSRK